MKEKKGSQTAPHVNRQTAEDRRSHVEIVTTENGMTYTIAQLFDGDRVEVGVARSPLT